jgi:dihydrofolate reductase
MSALVVIEHLTLDGVMQAPARPDEDMRGGFEHGGWAQARNDPAMGEAMGAHMPPGWNLLLGRRTYEDLYGFWPKQTEPNPFTEVLNTVQKYVASTTLAEPLAWTNSTLLKGDAAPAVAKLKAQGKDFVVFGSGELVRALAQRSLVDTYLLMIHPLVLGTGVRLFTDASAPAPLELAESVTTKTGVIVATYRTVHSKEEQVG